VVTGETYAGDPAARRRNAVFAVLATAYAIFLFVAAGLEFLLLSCLVYGPAVVLFVVARLERRRRVFTPPEAVLCCVICAGAMIALYELVTGGIVV